MPTRHKTSKSRTWHAWSGSLDDLRRISQIFEDLVEQRKPGLSASGSPADEERATVADWRRDRFDSTWAAVAVLYDGDEQIEGTPHEVLAEIDPRSMGKLTLSVSSSGTHVPGDALHVALDKKSAFRSVSLTVDSAEQGWARQAFAALAEEIEKGVPRWAWIRSELGRGALGVSISLIFYFAALVFIPASVEDLAEAVVAGGVGVFASIAVTATPLLDWFLPPLEVTTQGGSSGARRLAGLGLLLLSIPIGLLVNFLTG